MNGMTIAPVGGAPTSQESTGMKPVAALTATRRAGPIAGISYADDALDWWHRMTETSASVAKRQRAEVASWHRRNPRDVVRIIRSVRDSEDASREDGGRQLCI